MPDLPIGGLEAAGKAFTTLLVTVGPAEVAAMFLVLTAGAGPGPRRALAWKSTAIAGAVLLGFAFGGNALLRALDIGLPAFHAAGGVLLLFLSVDMLGATPTGLSSITPGEQQEARSLDDIAVFPLAIPLIAGPGTMTAIVLLMGRAQGGVGTVSVIGSLALVLAITLVSMLAADRLMRLLGVTGVNVVARVSGILLAALAMQFLLDGLKDSGIFAGLKA